MTITATTQPSVVPASDSYTGTDMTFTHNQFVVTPSYCELSIKCRSVTPVNGDLSCQELNSNNGLVFNFTPEDYTERRVAPGSYTFTFDVSADEGNADLTESFDVVVILEDPCINPTVTLPNS